MNHITLIEKRMSEEDKKQLKEIFAPRAVAVQPEDSRKGLCVMPDGEIRHYGSRDKKNTFDEGLPCYISSADGGLTWKYHEAAEECMGSCAYFESYGIYVNLTSVPSGENKGTYANVSKTGPDDTCFERKKISDIHYYDIFLPKLICGGKRIAVTAQTVIDGEYHPVFIYSDDIAKTWKCVHLPSAPKYEPVYPSVAPRWENNGSEPVFTELSDGTLYMIARTSLDRFYAYYSHDGGEHWTNGEPSCFHGTLTTPFFLELSNGKTLFFWNNTQPLPETNHSKHLPPHKEGFVFSGENVFTNRDASHVAISEDCVNWIGLRELYLNAVRNEPDFRTRGGIMSSADRSVHQFQALELPFGKVLVAVGQNAACRKLVIFDPEWLLEKERTEDFYSGLDGVSTQTYVKSISGCYISKGHPGHCSWNRTDGALLVPDPCMDGTEALHICRVNDPRLVFQRQGAVWNFPCAGKGRIEIRLRFEGEGLRVSLCDRWFNPCDETVNESAAFFFKLTPDTMDRGIWRDVLVEFDVSEKFANVFLDGKKLFGVLMKNTPEHGISYLHLQSDAENTDYDGVLIKKLSMHCL